MNRKKSVKEKFPVPWGRVYRKKKPGVCKWKAQFAQQRLRVYETE